MTKHTPGPWIQNYDYIDAPDPNPHGSGLIGICAMADWCDESEEERMANARLIAAAPDLLAALIFARPFMDVADLDSSQDLISDIDIAIAKAKGETT